MAKLPIADMDFLRLDQRRRRADEIKHAALAYVQDCGRQGGVLDLGEWGQRRWQRDSDVKRQIMIDAVGETVASGVPVVHLWQRHGINGFIARTLIGATSYADLYRILRDHQMPVGFRPGDVARWVADGKMSAAELVEIFGLVDETPEAFISAWLA